MRPPTSSEGVPLNKSSLSGWRTSFLPAEEQSVCFPCSPVACCCCSDLDLDRYIGRRHAVRKCADRNEVRTRPCVSAHVREGDAARRLDLNSR
jgi:hypothetical protein